MSTLVASANMWSHSLTGTLATPEMNLNMPTPLLEMDGLTLYDRLAMGG